MGENGAVNYTLRPYQEKAVDDTREKLRLGYRAPIIWLATGSGKTVIACHIIKETLAKNNGVWFLAHRNEMIMQCSAKLDENSVPHGIIKAGNKRIDPLALVQLASVQTLGNRLHITRRKPKLIIVDECHHAVAPSYRKILEANKQAIIIGLTATPYRADGRGLKEVFDCLIEVASIDELIVGGHLVKPRVFTGQRVNLAGVDVSGADYNQKQLAKVMNKPKVFGDIVESYLKHASDRLAVCFTGRVEYSKALRAAFMVAGVKAWHLDGTMNDIDRETVFDAFASSSEGVLCNCDVASEGWDCPPVSAVILGWPTKSRNRWRQRCGRGLRPYPGKIDCLILDHGNCTDAHGYLTDPDLVDLEQGTSGERRRPARKCPSCGAKYAGAPTFCPVCAERLVDAEEKRLDQSLFGDADFELVEQIDRPRRPARRRAKIDTNSTGALFCYLRDLKMQEEKGYKKGYAKGRHFGRTDHWPGRVVTIIGEDGNPKRVWENSLEKAGV